ncbi:MAG: hypothetical protein BMS9Abin05_1728 [Rhodothermia bacterium]|nr:MAG: hypothetical protein BMS9Abin05_1728 [Rhodothermia bacterium]
MILSNPVLRLLTGIFALLLVVTVAGCELFGEDSTELDELSSQRRIWQNYNSGTYSFVLTRSCFCVYAGEFQLFVKDNELTNIIPPWDDLEGVPKEDWNLFPTIDGLFDLIQEAYSGKADRISVDYSEHGYPATADIDYIENAIDDELFLGVDDLLMALD